MQEMLGKAEEILHCHIAGFHQYVLGDTVELAFVSESFCDLLGRNPKELLQEGAEGCAKQVHPDDREVYKGFLRQLSSGVDKTAVCYRVIGGSGALRYVTVSAVTEKQTDGTLAAHCVMTDVTTIQTENRDLRFLSETIPCGFLRYTCEKHPRITYLNHQMEAILRLSGAKAGEWDQQAFYRENLYLSIPMEERRRFSRFLERVYGSGVPVSGEMTVLRGDGTRARLYGWVAKSVDEQGREEFQSVCMDVTEKYRQAKAAETKRYLQALSEVYDKILEYDFSRMTVRYLHGQNARLFLRLQNVPMHLAEATEQWIEESVLAEDQERMRQFFRDVCRLEKESSEGRPPQVQYRIVTPKGEVQRHQGIFLQVDAFVRLFCSRRLPGEWESVSLHSENQSLRSMNENMQELVMHFTDGIVAFAVEDGLVRPMYASDNICEFFGYAKEAWIAMAQTGCSIKRFVSKSGVNYEKFMALLEQGEGEFAYVDVNTGKQKRVKAVCSHRTSDSSSIRYVMLYNMGETSRQTPGTDVPRTMQKTAVSADDSSVGRVVIRTFGYFDVFVGGKPIAFRNKKSKELFALLVDRRGGYVSSEEAISFLWEDEAVSAVTLARYRKVALRLKNILEEYGIPEVVESVDGKRRIVPEKVRCDLYDHLDHKAESAGRFSGSYLSNYSWGETTLGELLREHMV